MQASSVDFGTPLLQLPAVNQLPPLVFVQESVHPTACAAEGASTASPMIAAVANPIMRPRAEVCTQLLRPCIANASVSLALPAALAPGLIRIDCKESKATSRAE